MNIQPRALSLPSPDAVDLERRLSLFDATMIIVGNIIGMGIFTTPGWVAAALPDPFLIMAAWAVGGFLTFCGALTYAELGAAMPRAGGEYIYLREAYGPFWGFLNGWTYFLVTNPGSIALMSVAFVTYLERFLPASALAQPFLTVHLPFGLWRLSSGQLVAIGVIVCLSGINYLGVRAGSIVQNLLTVAKVGAIIAIAGLGILMGNGSWSHFGQPTPGHSPSSLLEPLSLAMISVFFSYTGWFTSTYVASEIKQPQRNLPYSIIAGTLVVTLLYLLVNLAYLYALPVEQMRGVVNIGEVAAEALYGHHISKYVSIAILVSILGAINSVVLTAPRIYYAMARDGLFFKSAGKVHARFKSPANAIILQAVWSCVLVGSGTFGQLLTYTTVAMLAFSIMTGGAIFRLRHAKPLLVRPYQTQGYPWVPLIFILSYSLVLLNILIARPHEAFWGLGIVTLGVPAYIFWQRRRMLRANAGG